MLKMGKRGGSGDVRGIFRLNLTGNGSNTTIHLLGGKDHLVFDLDWKDSNGTGGNNRTIYPAAFDNNHGNQKFPTSENSEMSGYFGSSNYDSDDWFYLCQFDVFSQLTVRSSPSLNETTGS